MSSQNEDFLESAEDYMKMIEDRYDRKTVQMVQVTINGLMLTIAAEALGEVIQSDTAQKLLPPFIKLCQDTAVQFCMMYSEAIGLKATKSDIELYKKLAMDFILGCMPAHLKGVLKNG
jgi:hypothetical protein